MRSARQGGRRRPHRAASGGAAGTSRRRNTGRPPPSPGRPPRQARGGSSSGARPARPAPGREQALRERGERRRPPQAPAPSAPGPGDAAVTSRLTALTVLSSGAGTGPPENPPRSPAPRGQQRLRLSASCRLHRQRPPRSLPPCCCRRRRDGLGLRPGRHRPPHVTGGRGRAGTGLLPPPRPAAPARPPGRVRRRELGRVTELSPDRLLPLGSEQGTVRHLRNRYL